MEGIIILLVLALVVAPIAVAVWAIVQASGAKRQVQELNLRLDSLQADLQALRKTGSHTPTAQTGAASPAATSIAATLLEHRVDRTAQPSATPAPPPLPATAPTVPPAAPRLDAARGIADRSQHAAGAGTDAHPNGVPGTNAD